MLVGRAQFAFNANHEIKFLDTLAISIFYWFAVGKSWAWIFTKVHRGILLLSVVVAMATAHSFFLLWSVIVVVVRNGICYFWIGLIMCVQYHNKHNDQHYHNTMSFFAKTFFAWFNVSESEWLSCYFFFFWLLCRCEKVQHKIRWWLNFMRLYKVTGIDEREWSSTKKKSHERTQLFPFVLIGSRRTRRKKMVAVYFALRFSCIRKIIISCFSQL